MSDTAPASALLRQLRAAVDPLGTPDAQPPSAQRRAAVLLLADPAQAALPLLFMVRSHRVRHHRGQIAFPGGVAESAEETPQATALRENAEEMGIAPSDVEVIGKLPPLVSAASNRWLTPVVGVLRRDSRVLADPFEVAEWFRVPLIALLAAPHRIERVIAEGCEREVHYYEAGGRIIWGVTGAIVNELLTRLGRTD
jgi:8-oxo-dGTP pyrophosphatase MutT (NUDIX family)